MGEGRWTIARLLDSMRSYFAERGIASARLDAELLLAHVLAKPRIYLYTHYDQPVHDAERDVLRALCKRRGAREPMAYILGEQEFYGRSFLVDARVLVPRPETELLVDAALDFLRQQKKAPVRVLDIGTGSGALAITLALEYPAAQVAAIDVSAQALQVAQHNGERLGAQVQWCQADACALGTAWPPSLGAEPYTLVVSNPPYLGEDERAALMPEVGLHEPSLALFAPQQGRAVLEAVLAVAAQRLADPGLLAMEMAPRHAPWLLPAAQRALGQARLQNDLAGLSRVCLAQRGELVAANDERAATPTASQLQAPDAQRD